MQPIRTSFRTPHRRHAGFTLIEVMITVAIVGILVRIAYPAYNQSVLKSHRAEAKSALLDLAAREERYFSTANQYSNLGPVLGYAATSTLTVAAPLPIQTGSATYYNLSVQVPDPNAPTGIASFIATATAVNAQTGDVKCKNFTLTQAGIQGNSGGNTDTPANCW